MTDAEELNHMIIALIILITLFTQVNLYNYQIAIISLVWKNFKLSFAATSRHKYTKFLFMTFTKVSKQVTKSSTENFVANVLNIEYY